MQADDTGRSLTYSQLKGNIRHVISYSRGSGWSRWNAITCAWLITGVNQAAIHCFLCDSCEGGRREPVSEKEA